MNKVYIVEYTNEDCVGNQTLQMEIEAPNLETAYEIVDAHYPDLAIDTIYDKAEEEAWDAYWDRMAGENFAGV